MIRIFLFASLLLSQAFAQSPGEIYRSHGGNIEFMDNNVLKIRTHSVGFSWEEAYQYTIQADSLFLQAQIDGKADRIITFRLVEDYALVNGSNEVFLKEPVYQKYAKKALIVIDFDDQLYPYPANKKAPREVRKKLERNKDNVSIEVIRGVDALLAYGPIGYFGVIKVEIE